MLPQSRSEALNAHDGLSRDDLRQNLARFLREVVPVTEELGVNPCVHPDDPSCDVLGLPRIAAASRCQIA